MKLTLNQLAEIMPNAPLLHLAGHLPFLQAACNEFEINTPDRMAAFLAQLAHESSELRYFEEIASGQEYEGRADLGNTLPGDGKRYKGRGPIQLTGRNNYRKCGAALGIDLEALPLLAEHPDIAFRTAGWFWSDRKLNSLADGGPLAFNAISVRINGRNKKTGEPNGKAERDAYYAVARKVLGC